MEAPLRVRGLPRPPGAAWRRVAAGVFGEWQTREWLARAGGGGAGKAAAGWGGDRYELWRRGPLPAEDCAAPCAARDVLVLRWRWDTARDARDFRGAVDGALGEVAEGAATAVRKRGRQVTVVLGGEGGLARRLANEVR